MLLLNQYQTKRGGQAQSLGARGRYDSWCLLLVPPGNYKSAGRTTFRFPFCYCAFSIIKSCVDTRDRFYKGSEGEEK